MGKERELTALERLIAKAIGDSMDVGNPADPASKTYPVLWEWLTNTAAGKDHVKEPAKLAIRAVPGGFHVALQDIDLSVQVEVVTPHLESFTQALEQALTGPCPPIKRYGRVEKTLRKRKSKT